MKRSVLAVIATLCAAPMLAQTPTGAQPATRPPGAANQTITMTGCVGGQGSDAQPYMLNNPLVVPSTPANPPGAVGATAGVAGSQPPTVAPTPSSPATAAMPPAATPTPPSTTGTAGTNPVGTTGAAGTAGAATAGTSSVAGTAPTGASATPAAVAPGAASSVVSGYRLSGSDMAAWTGQRVEIVGSVVGANAGVASGAGATTTTAEFRVQSVRAIGGSCPQ